MITRLANILFCLGILLGSCHAETNMKQYQTINDKPKLLKKYYNDIVQGNSKDRTKYERLFFEAFPSTFQEFSDLYGFEDKPMSLYSEGEKHIALFDSIRSIPQKELYAKYINIGINGNWQADNISDFQSRLYTKMYNNTKEMLDVLSTYNSSQINSFWYFLFDGPHPEDPQAKQMFKKLYEKLKMSNSKMAETALSQHEILLKNADKHDH